MKRLTGMRAAAGEMRTHRRKMADGTVKTYEYPRTGKRRWTEEHSSSSDSRDFIWLVAQYRSSPEFERLAPLTRSGYRGYLDALCDRLGWMTLRDLEDRRARTEFYALRDSMTSTPSQSDHHIGILRTVLAWGYRRGHLGINHALGIEPLVSTAHSRAEIVWSEDDRAVFERGAPANIRRAFQLALLTAARLSDLCAMRWSDIDETGWLVYTPQKTRRHGVQIHIPTFALSPLQDLLHEIPRNADTILSLREGVRLNSGTLGIYFRAERDRLLPGADLHFHDLRGTAITEMLDAGCTEIEAASISGHAVGGIASQGRGIGNMRRYVKQTRERALNACTKWNAYLTDSGRVVYLDSRRT